MEMNIEQSRLQTFENWPADAPIEATRLAKAGFYSTGGGENGDSPLEVQCHWCQCKISDWQYGDQVRLTVTEDFKSEF